MRIELYLADKVATFTLPPKITGSYSFDDDYDEEIKLINIEAKNGRWFLCANQYVQIISSDAENLKEVPLTINTYYILQRKNKNYLIYIEEIFSRNMTAYAYDKRLNLLIGYSASCNVLYNCPYLNSLEVAINFLDDKLVLQSNKASNVYINNYALTDNKYYIKNGDVINIYGLKITFFNKYMLISDPISRLSIPTSIPLTQFAKAPSAQLLDLDVEAVDLYNTDDYFSKPPRIRRIIEPKEITISPLSENMDNNERPFILVAGPMITMALISTMMGITTVNRLVRGTSSLADSWPSLAMCVLMILSAVLWPSLTNRYTNKIKARKKEQLTKKYLEYLKVKRGELEKEYHLQKEILNENLKSVNECLQAISNHTVNFWDKRIDQNDFLLFRVGTGNDKFQMDIKTSEEDFNPSEEELVLQQKKLVAEFKELINVPIGYSFYENPITAIMGSSEKSYNFLNNIILQLITFYSYDDVKIVIFSENKNATKWEYIKYLNYNFSDDKSFRFFSTNSNSFKPVIDYLNNEFIIREQSKEEIKKPYYFIIIDGYNNVKKYEFFKHLTEQERNLGFSLIILENQLSSLPSLCNNFISLGDRKSLILIDSFNHQQQKVFYDEINYNVNMMSVAKIVSNVPIQLENNVTSFPSMISFLEMEKVSRVSQLNVTARWKNNDSTNSLKAEVGIDESGNLMYLDLHEKYHGPHGLIAGMTGSGKSEFIITYILSMCINYSPDDVAFILIDYKGGGLAFAFENRTSGVVLPHLAGTITNLDKAEMDRSLVSIDSEVKRRQKVFNEARDKLGESTMDIYKYQHHYHEKKLDIPVPHLFIVCDEFAELKSQQPDFMDNLISVARIGRSLGVHLILATQKPSGVVNEQIWSNSKFKVCLKVQDTSDSKEMIKKPDAAFLKETGRFYLQVGYDEYFALGQSAWCGAKYYPADKIMKQVDNSINFIDENGNFIKSVYPESNTVLIPEGEQLAAILECIIGAANDIGKKAQRLWLDSLPPLILIDDIVKKYGLAYEENPYCIIGEYDAPEKQEQGLLRCDFLQQGNTVIYGSDSEERELVLNAMIYSSILLNSSQNLNIYIMDFGSESLIKYKKSHLVGGITISSEEDRIINLFKMVIQTIHDRKKILLNAGMDYDTYNRCKEKKLTTLCIYLNHYGNFKEYYPKMSETFEKITRDCIRYGIIFIVSCDNQSTLTYRVNQNFTTFYFTRMNDASNYYEFFGFGNKVEPRKLFGRGLADIEGAHEFQTASITEQKEKLNDFVFQKINQNNEINKYQAPPIKELPEIVDLHYILPYYKEAFRLPLGVSKETLNIVYHDLQKTNLTILSQKLNNVNKFLNVLLELTTNFNTTLFFDFTTNYKEAKAYVKNYFDQEFELVIDNLIQVLTNQLDQKTLVYFYGFSSLKNIPTKEKITELFTRLQRSKFTHAVFIEEESEIRNINYEAWFQLVKITDSGLWIGKGFSEQAYFKINKYCNDRTNYNNDFGFYINEGEFELIKIMQMKEESDEK